MQITSNYQSKLNIFQTEEGIKYIKDTFQQSFVENLHLIRVSAPMFVRKNSGLNDNLSGYEKPIGFEINNESLEIVHSLAKWKRMVLRRYSTEPGFGIYTDMNAIRKDEHLDSLHSIYVDQWDWELIITKEQRNITTLHDIVLKIYESLQETAIKVCEKYPSLTNYFEKPIYFVNTTELANKYPNYSPKEREDAICKEYGAVFIEQIGDKLANGLPKHDDRAPDYDDWSLNGDILIYYPPLNCAVELSSMGIRVDEEALKQQLAKAHCEERLELPFHQQLLQGKLPYTVGGGIGQSRLCLVMLNKVHIGEVQSSYWNKETLDLCKKHQIRLL